MYIAERVVYIICMHVLAILAQAESHLVYVWYVVCARPGRV